MVRVWIVLALLTVTASGCATTNYDCRRVSCEPAWNWGIREPLQPATPLEDFKAGDTDPFAEFLKQRRYAEELIAFMDSRTLLNRGAVYVGSVAMIGASSATAGLAAFGASATAAAKALPIGTAFLGGLFGIFDSRHQAQIYTEAANELRTVMVSSTAAFLREPDYKKKRLKTLQLQTAIADTLNNLRLQLNAALPTQAQVLETMQKVQARIEETAGVKPKILAITPSVATEAAGQVIVIRGSGFGPDTKVWLDGTPAPGLKTAGTTQIEFTTFKPTGPRSYSVLVQNGYGKETTADTSFVQADLKVTSCRAVSHPDPDKDGSEVVFLVEGQGFFDASAGGSIDVKTGAAVKTTKTWRAHTQWEVVVEKQGSLVPVTEIVVANAGTTAKLTGAPALGPDCANVPVKKTP